ncbi:hypothetical protein L208DRAFT_1262348, partial [Tricholoma matsutake]
HREKAMFEVCNLGKALMILGHPWLRKNNSEIDWIMRAVKMMQCPHECNMYIRAVKKKLAAWWMYKPSVEEIEDEDMKDGVQKTVEEKVPEQFHKHLKVFEKKASERMPKHQPWDYESKV